MYKYYVDGGVPLCGYADYDGVTVKGKAVLLGELDYKMVVFVLQQGKIYRRKVTFKDDGSINISSKLVYSF